MLFLIDARAGLVPDDRVFADLIRKSGKPAIVAANKSEGKAGEAGRLEAYALGLGDPLAISAEHGEGLSDLYDALREALPEATAEPAKDEDATDDDPARPIRVAVIGRPNAGKSTLINRLLGAGAPADRAGGRHHARHHRGRSRLAGPRLPPLRHRGHPPAGRRCRRSSKSSRSPTRCTPSASPRSWCC